MPEEPAALAIDGGSPLRSVPWPAAPSNDPATDVDPVPGAEAALAEALQLAAGHVVSYGSTDAAWHAVLGLIERGARREIVVPALLGEQAATAARAAGWVAVPGDVEADTAAISARGFVRALSEGTAGGVVVHAFGHPAVMPDILRVAEERDLTIIEDLSGALGASLRGAPAGRMGRVAVFTGRSGDPVTRGVFAIFTEEDEATAARAARTDAMGEDDARVALGDLRRLEDELTQRRRLAWEVTFNMRGMKAMASMPHGRWIHHAYSAYVVRVRGILWKRSLAETVAAIRAEGVECELACGDALHLDAAIAGALPDDPRVSDDAFTVANRLPDELIAIPLHSNLTSKDMDEVAAVLRKVEARSI